MILVEKRDLKDDSLEESMAALQARVQLLEWKAQALYD